MAQIIWTDHALLGLRQIIEYIEIFNPKAAASLSKSIFSKIDRLSAHPLSSPIVEELPDHAFRQLVVNPVRVIYSFDGDSIYIMHVIRQEQDLKKVLMLD